MNQQRAVSINKDLELDFTQDYQALREKGLEWVQTFCGDTWTDHNTHDPGITIMEVLSFGLADLGYRLGLPIKDLLFRANENDGSLAEYGFFPAHEIFPVNPLTIADYRRLITKIAGVRNAWLNPLSDPCESDYGQSEIPVFVNCPRKRLTLDPSPNHQPLHIRGLYKVMVELGIDPELGSLNEEALQYRFNSGTLLGLIVEVDHPGINDVLDNAAKAILLTDPLPSVKILSDSIQMEVREGDLIFTFLYHWGNDAGNTIQLNNFNIRVLGFADKPIGDFDALTAQIKEASSLELLLGTYLKKYSTRIILLDCILRVLMAHRNLCEDFLSIETVKTEKIAVCANFEIAPNADIELIKAKILWKIQQYFNPPVKRISLNELLKEQAPQDIFSGPYFGEQEGDEEEKNVFTRGGFVTDEILGETRLREEIRTADLINLIMDLKEEGVLAVKDMILRKTKKDGSIEEQRWVMKIERDHQPLLDEFASRFRFFKQGVPFEAKDLEYRVLLEQLRSSVSENEFIPNGETLSIERGRDRELTEYFTIHDDFPLVYGVGSNGFPAHATERRKDQARQLEAYLTLFDQLLYDGMSQASHIQELLSPKSIDETFLTGNLTNASGHRENFVSEVMHSVAGNSLSDESLRESMIEDSATGAKKRVLILNHLLSRFGFDTDDHLLHQVASDGWELQDQRFQSDMNLPQQSIQLKEEFLRQLPMLTRNRGKGYNYVKAEGLLDSNNVSGLEKLVKAILGMKTENNRWLCPSGVCADEEKFHLIEHLLLRPMNTSWEETLLAICLGDDCEDCGARDPYSFRVTIVFPAWPLRFTNMGFRRYVEQSIREETPAHIYPKICWIDKEQMAQFESLYQTWMEARAQHALMSEEYLAASTELIKLLAQLENIYPSALLHDCEEDIEDKPVILGSTPLGQGKNE